MKSAFGPLIKRRDAIKRACAAVALSALPCAIAEDKNFSEKPKSAKTREFDVVVCGGGHVGRNLLPMAKMVGFDVLLVDTRAPEIISEAVSLADRFERVSDFRSGLCALDIEPEAYYVLCAYSHAADCAALQAVLDKSWAYAGMVGSRTKIDSIFSQLRQKGYTNAQLSRVHTPIGLDLGGETPAEIAVAIMAQIIAIQHGKQK